MVASEPSSASTRKADPEKRRQLASRWWQITAAQTVPAVRRGCRAWLSWKWPWKASSQRRAVAPIHRRAPTRHGTGEIGRVEVYMGVTPSPWGCFKGVVRLAGPATSALVLPESSEGTAKEALQNGELPSHKALWRRQMAHL